MLNEEPQVHKACVVEPQVHTACVVEPQVP
jgi:hypothetical protein